MVKRRINVPPMVSDLIRNGLTAMEGVAFTQRERCPSCGGYLQGYDARDRLFVTLIEESGTRDIMVQVKRFSCRTCGQVSSADAPFYPDTRYGSPVVDLALALTQTMSYRRVANVLALCHIAIDWGTVRHYHRRLGPVVPTFDMYGIPLPLSLLYLSILAVQLTKGTPITGAEALAACCPPSAHGTFPVLAGSL
ncbi:MAG: hypothetical protein LUO82_02605 [Methanomicrobiales archaeon]|nr:hypothetical protein [Methanomicrobiales archaeon]